MRCPVNGRVHRVTDLLNPRAADGSFGGPEDTLQLIQALKNPEHTRLPLQALIPPPRLSNMRVLALIVLAAFVATASGECLCQ